MGDVERIIPRIYATLDGRQVDHQSRMIEVAGNIGNVHIHILIDSRAIHSYIAPNIFERHYLKKIKLETIALVQLALGFKKNVT